MIALELTKHFRQEKDPNVWAVLLGSFSTINSMLEEEEPDLLAALVRDRLTPAWRLGWEPKPGERDGGVNYGAILIRALWNVGPRPGDANTSASACSNQPIVGAAPSFNVLPALVSILAFTGDDARYDEFLRRFRKAATPQEERRYLFRWLRFARLFSWNVHSPAP
ncbi:MAG: ERAP1-like C-terminal domain-containing protein [Nitrospiraceae bacterium]